MLTPSRIITIGPSDSNPPPILPNYYGSGEVPGQSPVGRDDGIAAPPDGALPVAPAKVPARSPLASEELIPIDSEPSEPTPVSVEPVSIEQLDEGPTLRPPPAPQAASFPEPDGEDIALDDEPPTPAPSPVEMARPSPERHSDPGSEISVEDLLAVDAAPSPRAPMARLPVRPGGPSQPPIPPKPPLVIVPPHVGTMAPQPVEGAAARRKGRFWWEDLFNDDYLRTCERLTDAQLSSEVHFIEDRLSIEQGGTVLDLACGTGRHAIELARRGYEVVGFDLSLPMLARAGEEAQEREAKLNFVQGDMREMAFEEQFDGVYCWNTSFGYFEEDKNAQVIDRVHRSLKAGGLLLLDVANRDFLIRQSPSLAWFEGDGCVCMDEMSVDFITSRMKVKRTMMFDDGRSREIEYSMRVYSLHELGRILHEHRFKVCEVSGRTATPGVFFGNESPRIIILAEKR